jgi:hypothetical protein
MAVLPGVYEINQGETMDLFRFACNAKSNVLVLGPAGGGKTQMAQQAAAESGYRHIYIDLSVLEAPDFVGLPVVTKTKGADGRDINFVDYATPRFMPTCDSVDTSEKPFVLIFDELDKSRPELQAPLLEVFAERSINGRKLHVGGIMATGNLPDENAFSQPISHALTNRCSVYKMMVDFPSWQGWAVKAGVNPLVVGFLSRKQEWLLKPAPEGDPTAYCHPSPRAWSNASRDLDSAGDRVSPEFQFKLVAGRVGVGAATQFKVWLDFYREIEPFVDALVREGKSPGNLSVDKLIVFAISAAGQIASACRHGSAQVQAGKSKKAQEQEKILKVTKNVCGWLSKQDTEYQIAALKNALDMELVREWNLVQSQEFMVAVQRTKVAID